MQLPDDHVSPDPSYADYTLTFYTSDETGAGTDANITVTLHGDRTSSDPFVVNERMRGNVFERGSADSVSLRLAYLGKLTGLTIRSDGKYAGADWKLHRVEVKSHPEYQGEQTFVFGCYRWIGAESVELT